MRSLLALLPALALLAAPASAQATFGLKLGVGAADLTDIGVFEDTEDFGFEERSRLALVGGVTADVPLSPSLSFRPEVLYAQKGYTVGVDVSFGDERIEGAITSELDYLEVPLLLAFHVPASDALDVAVEAGPTLGYLLRTGTSCSGDLEVECEDAGDFDGEDGIRDVDLGGALGATLEAGPFGVGLRYTHGFVSIAEDDEISDDDFSPRNRVFAATVSYRFGR